MAVWRLMYDEGKEKGEVGPPGIHIYELGTMNAQDRERIMRRAGRDIREVLPEVLPIIEDVRKRGDDAVIEYIEEFDKVKLTPESLRVSQADIEEAYAKTDQLF